MWQRGATFHITISLHAVDIEREIETESAKNKWEQRRKDNQSGSQRRETSIAAKRDFDQTIFEWP